MAFTPDQETFLAALADKGLAEQQEIADRNAQVLKDNAVQAARDAKLVDLQAQAQALIDNGLADFDNNIAPIIVAETPAEVQPIGG